jgi:HSP20 family protein
MLVSYQKPVQSYPSIVDWVFTPDSQVDAQRDYAIEELTDGYSVTIDVPGVAPEEISLRIEDRAIKLVTKRSIGGHSTEKKYRWRLPRSANADAVNATLSHGVLTLSVPKPESSLPRDIEIQSE